MSMMWFNALKYNAKKKVMVAESSPYDETAAVSFSLSGVPDGTAINKKFLEFIPKIGGRLILDIDVQLFSGSGIANNTTKIIVKNSAGNVIGSSSGRITSEGTTVSVSVSPFSRYSVYFESTYNVSTSNYIPHKVSFQYDVKESYIDFKAVSE